MKKFTLFLFTITFSVAALAQTDIVITEIMYNSPESNTDSLEWLEIYNKGQSTIDLSGYYFTQGIEYTFPSGVSLDAGSYMILAGDSVAFNNVYGMTARQWEGGALSNGGEDLTILDSQGGLVDSVDYDNSSPWPTSPDGDGNSLVLCDPTQPNADNTNWEAASTATGIYVNAIEIVANPGAGCSVTPPSCPTLYINEVMASNDGTVADEDGDYDDWFEVYNPNNFSVDIAGYYVTDDLNDLTKFQIGTGEAATIIPANGFVLVWCDDEETVPGALHANFKLTAGGEDAAIVCTDGTTIIDQVSFPAIGTDTSYGRESDGDPNWVFFYTSPTPGATNSVVSANSTQVSKVQVIKAFPNPVINGVVYFNQNITGGIFNSLGQFVATINNDRKLDVIGWEAGLYTLKTEEGKISKFLIK